MTIILHFQIAILTMAGAMYSQWGALSVRNKNQDLTYSSFLTILPHKEIHAYINQRLWKS
jgi:hypothetical protein